MIEVSFQISLSDTNNIVVALERHGDAGPEVDLLHSLPTVVSGLFP